MISEMEAGLHWTDHYVKYGFAVRRGLVDRAFCDEALLRAREIIENDLPLREWDTSNAKTLHRPFYEGATPPEPVFDRVMDQPRLRAEIDELFGGPGEWNGERNYYLFLKAYQEDAKPSLAPMGHIDFTTPPIPALYRGFTFQLSLIDSEPFSGNLTVYPGTHKTVQKRLMETDGMEFRSGQAPMEVPDPFEFVADAGDVIFVHHLIQHSGNNSHSANRVPRVALHGEAFRDAWLESIDPNEPGMSPWKRSLAFNGAYTAPHSTEVHQMKHRIDYLDKLRSEGAAAVQAY